MVGEGRGHGSCHSSTHPHLCASPNHHGHCWHPKEVPFSPSMWNIPWDQRSPHGNAGAGALSPQEAEAHAGWGWDSWRRGLREGREGRTWAKGCVDKQCLEGDLVAPGASSTSHNPSLNQAPEVAIVTLGQWRPVSCKPLWFKKEGQNYLDKLHSNRRLGEK